jgi:hypothetical protein
MIRIALVCALLAALLPTMSAFSVHDKSAVVSRRDSFSQAASLFGGVGVASILVAGTPLPSLAVVTDETPKITTRMGGLLENYQDSRGWTILAPSGWNKFDGEVGAYDTKWQDLVDPTDNIKLSSTPVKSTTTSV